MNLKGEWTPIMIRISRKARKGLARIEPKEVHDDVQKVIGKLARDPRPIGVKKLKGKSNHYRIRRFVKENIV